MKFWKFSLLLSAALLAACSMTRTDYHDRDMLQHNRQNIVAYGAERAKIIGPVFWTSPGHCSEIAFLKSASLSNGKIKNVIDIKMEQTVNNTTNSSFCDYSGLAVSYESLTLEEAEAWHDIGDSTAVPLEKKVPKDQVVKPSIAPYIWGGISTVAAVVLLIVLL